MSFVLLNGLLLQATYTICTTRSVNVCIERPLHTEKHSAMPSLNERLDFVSFAFGAGGRRARRRNVRERSGRSRHRRADLCERAAKRRRLDHMGGGVCRARQRFAGGHGEGLLGG